MDQHICVPSAGKKVSWGPQGRFNVPANPIIPFIEGDGTGFDVVPVMQRVLDAAVSASYAGERQIHWMEVYAGDKAVALYGEALPEATLSALREYGVSIKGPLAPPSSSELGSLNVALRQALDLYACVRPIRYFAGVPSPLKEPERTQMVVFRESSEDIYAGIEYEAHSPQASQLINFLTGHMGVTRIRFPDSSGVGIKPVSREGSERLIRKAIQYAIAHDLPSVTLVHKGNIMRFTEGSFRDWGYALAQKEFGAKTIDGGPWCQLRNPNTGKRLVIKDSLTDAFLQHSMMRPMEYSVIATMNLNGDYLSDALAAQVGGVGIAPSGNLSDQVAMFEVTHGAARKYARKDYVNPSSCILAGEMMLRHLGWGEAADRIMAAMEKTFASKRVTYDFARLMEGAIQVSCSRFGEDVIAHMQA